MIRKAGLAHFVGIGEASIRAEPMTGFPFNRVAGSRTFHGISGKLQRSIR
ncbi:MAG: hypothetical protein OJF50_005914 [Nitrospira sp.]|nr:hypothetical protein [Nitrospira sp.]